MPLFRLPESVPTFSPTSVPVIWYLCSPIPHVPSPLPDRGLLFSQNRRSAHSPGERHCGVAPQTPAPTDEPVRPGSCHPPECTGTLHLCEANPETNLPDNHNHCKWEQSHPPVPEYQKYPPTPSPDTCPTIR